MTASAQPAQTRVMRPDLWVLIVLGIAGIFYFFLKFNESFPSASIDLRVPKRQIAEMARNWAKEIGYTPTNTIASTVFTFDDDAKTFLEYELGQGAANQLMSRLVPIWTWRTRFCRPFEQEECSIGMQTDGRLGYIDHSIPNDAKLPSISHDEARKVAEDFVAKKVGLSLTGTKLIDDSETKQVNRVDHYFTWEDQKREFEGGRLRTYVYIAGNTVTQFNKYLHVPETFERKYSEIRSWNELLKSISSIVYVILSSAISFVFIWSFAQGKIRWRFAFIAGALAALFSLLGWIDGWPSIVSSYPTTTPFQQYVTESVIQMLVSAVGSAVAAIVFVGALEPVYRSMFPQKVALEKIFTGLGLRSPSVFQGLVAGLAVFGLHTAYVVAFYLLGQHIGFWSPLEVRDTATLSGLFPAYEAINVGVVASTMEEFMYRVLGLALFQRLTKNFWIANFLQAASWAFMHSDYPQEPAYARGVELTIGGFFYGWVLRRFGLLACILAHYTYDAFLGVTPLIVSSSIADRLQSMLAVAPGIIALIVSGVLIWRRGVLADEAPIENASIVATHRPPPAKEIEAPKDYEYKPLSKRVRLGIIAAAAVLWIAASLVKLHVIGQNATITITRDQATAIGAQYLQEHGISTRGMRSVAWITDQADETELQYVFEKEKYDRTKELAKSLEPRLLWRVRFFKELDPTEYYVTMSTSGKPQTQYVVLEEDAAAKSISQEEAKTKVQQFLQREHPELGALQFEDSTKHDRKARTDYDVDFKIPTLKAGEAEYKVYSGTVGDQVSGFSRGWQIPDQWLFERNKVTQKDQVFNIVRRIFAVLLVVVSLIWLVDILRAHTIRWKPAIIAGAIVAGATVVSYLNSLPTFMMGYRTEEAIQTFLMTQGVQYILGILSSTGGMILLAAFAYGAFRRMFPDLSIGSLIRPVLPKGLGGSGSNRDLWLDGIIVGYGLSIVLFGLDFLLDAASYYTSPAVHLYNLSSIRSIADEFSPALGVLSGAVSMAVLSPVVAIITASAVRKFLGTSFIKPYAVMIAMSAIAYSGTRYWQDYAWNLAATALMAPIVYWSIRYVARLNLLCYALGALFLSLAAVTAAMIRNGYQVYFADVAVLIAAILAPFAYLIWLYKPSPSPPRQDS